MCARDIWPRGSLTTYNSCKRLRRTSILKYFKSRTAYGFKGSPKKGHKGAAVGGPHSQAGLPGPISRARRATAREVQHQQRPAPTSSTLILTSHVDTLCARAQKKPKVWHKAQIGSGEGEEGDKQRTWVEDELSGRVSTRRRPQPRQTGHTRHTPHEISRPHACF